MKIVLDTNVWLSAIFWEGEANNLVEKCIKNKIEIIISYDILSEIIDVLNKETKFQRFIQEREDKVEDLIRTILSISSILETSIKISEIKEHVKDNIILEAALEGNAEYIISYDNHVLDLIEFRKIRILSPTDFLKVLNK